MHPFLRIPKSCLITFFLGALFGFSICLVFPGFGKAGYAFQLQQANWLGGAYSGVVQQFRFTSMIYLRNCLIAILIAILPFALLQHALAYRRKHPFKSTDFNLALRNEIHVSLTMYSIATLFAYGFFVFGLFLGSVFALDSFRGLLQWSVYLVPHGILETFVIISAASRGILIRDDWLRNFNPLFPDSLKPLPWRGYLGYLFTIAILLIFSSFLEVYVSRGFVDFIFRFVKV
jgi:uncharacterized membrane protein SpoIIM required for sporulation